MGEGIKQVIESLLSELEAKSHDAVLLERGSSRTAYLTAAQELSGSWGPPTPLDTQIGALLDLLGAGFGEATVSAWRRGSAIAYVAWRRGPEKEPELLCGVCRPDDLPHLFLNPLAVGEAHAIRTSGLFPIGATVKPRERW